MSQPVDVLIRKLQEHSDLGPADLDGLRALPVRERLLVSDEDVVRQGDRPNISAIVLDGMLARYQTLPSGRRQYLSLHIRGDMPDAQALFLDRMDHGLCAANNAAVLLASHDALVALIRKRPNVGFAVWRETLIDAAIFREHITNNSARSVEARLAHLFCEQYYRGRLSGYAVPGAAKLPLTQTQLGELLGASLPSINRALRTLRQTGSVDFRASQIHIRNWRRLVKLGEFDPTYLHVRKLPRSAADLR